MCVYGVRCLLKELIIGQLSLEGMKELVASGQVRFSLMSLRLLCVVYVNDVLYAKDRTGSDSE